MSRQIKLKTITQAKYLEAFALFTLASQHQTKVGEFFGALKETLGGESGHMSDALWGDMGTFDEALAKEGFAVKPAPKKKRR